MKESRLIKEFVIRPKETNASKSLNNTMISNRLKTANPDSKISKQTEKEEVGPVLPRWIINVEETKKSTKISSMSRRFLDEYK